MIYTFRFSFASSGFRTAPYMCLVLALKYARSLHFTYFLITEAQRVTICAFVNPLQESRIIRKPRQANKSTNNKLREVNPAKHIILYMFLNFMALEQKTFFSFASLGFHISPFRNLFLAKMETKDPFNLRVTSVQSIEHLASFGTDQAACF